MNLEQLKHLIGKGESGNIEFKKSTGQLRAAFETICAFLNGQGGTVLLGVDNTGKIIGQDITDNTRQEIAREINKLEPTAQIDVQEIVIKKDKYVIVLQANSDHHIPYTYDGRPFQRNQTTTMRMSQHRYEQLLVERGRLNHSWEELTAEDYDINSLDHEEIHLAVRQGIAVNRVPAEAQSDSIEDILARWKLIKDGKINNAAAVLFAKDTMPRYSQCHIKLGRLNGTDMLGDFIDNQEFFGNAFRMLSAANNFIMRHLPIASFFDPDHFERIDKPTLPVLAVREAIVNAICHRDYSNRSASIALAIFDDRMEIWNNGMLPLELKLDDLRKQHRSYPRNKIISKVFYDRKFFDGWGTGTNKIVNLCLENNVPEPKFEEYSGGLAVIFKFKESIGISRPSPSTEEQLGLTLRQKKILKIIEKEGKIALREIVSLLKTPVAARTIGDDLAYLKQLGLVDSEGTAKRAKWFLTTSAGQ